MLRNHPEIILLIAGILTGLAFAGVAIFGANSTFNDMMDL